MSVPGRARLNITGLRHSAALQELLESTIPGLPDVQNLSASSITGNALVEFDPGRPVDDVIACIEAVLRGDVTPSGSEPEPAWHARQVGEILAEFATSADSGLSDEEAATRLAQVGQNEFPSIRGRTGLQILAGQFQTLPVALLGCAAVVSVLTGGIAEAVSILAVLALNGGIGYAVESRSERTIRSLSEPAAEDAAVIRDGREMLTPATSVVPGDLLVLRSGMAVAADARVVSADELTVSEALLTGESAPVSKVTAPAGDQSTPIGERVSMVYRGTVVTGGSGRAVAVATGSETQIGRIRRLIVKTGPPVTPMQGQLEVLGRWIGWGALAACGGVFGISFLRGLALMQAFRSAASLAVAAIPEGMPAVAATTLALGIENMRRRNVLVRRMDAVETLASVDVVCFDKTGTLTLNSMSVTAIAAGDGSNKLRINVPQDRACIEQSEANKSLDWLLRICVLCSEARIDCAAEGGPRLEGSATESALVQAAMDFGVDAQGLRAVYPRIAIQHRSEAYRYMVSTHTGPDSRRLIAVKGSPDDVLHLCSAWLDRDEVRPLSPDVRDRIAQANAAMASDALRVLGFAFRHVAADEENTASELTWVGLAGLTDPVRPGIQALMSRLHRAGIHTLVMTGDQVMTARAVARQLGLSGKDEIGVIDAVEADSLDTDELAAAARRAHVFARVSPAQKLRVIRALQQRGAVVAMVGDGINDSPALKAADVGIAMGRNGTAAAREVADVVLRSDDLAVLIEAIERGRAIYLNVRRSIRYLLGTNLSEMLVFSGGLAAGRYEPLLVSQLLWINLISDVAPGLGLALEPPAPGLMLQPPHARDEPMLPPAVIRQTVREGSAIACGALFAGAWGGLRYGLSAETRTMTFLSLVTAQLLHALTCRPPRQHGSLPPNNALTGILIGSFALQFGALLLPGVRGILSISSLGITDIAMTLAGGLLPSWINIALKTDSLSLRHDSREQPTEMLAAPAEATA